MSAVLDRRLPLSWFHVNTLVQVEPLPRTFVPGLFFLPLLAVPMAWAVLPRKSLVGGARQTGWPWRMSEPRSIHHASWIARTPCRGGAPCHAPAACCERASSCHPASRASGWGGGHP